MVDSFSREVITQAINDIAQCPGYNRYLAFKNGEITGAASLRIDGGIALLTGATTLPEHRRHGIQGALLAERLSAAQDRDAEIAIITTGVGTRSQANATRRGFSLLYSRAILVREF